ncbi:MAG: PQQ-like beta-propeller repeat protein [Planctomycetaceae bacterium]|nr:PQQ-like beta-propeller repeat protein [Planctomycetaceae bacterium]
MRRSWAFLIILVLSVHNVFAENWPCWRGPRGDGTSLEPNVPVQWSAADIVWQTELPGAGHASPIVWEDRVFTASAIADTHEKLLLCLDRKSGACLWRQTVLKTPFEKKHNDNSFASGTPATDGQFVYISLLDGKEIIVAAYDFSGKQAWLVRLGTFDSPHGYACSPVLWQDKIIINASSNTGAFVAALDRADGRTLWKTAFEKDALSFATPIIRTIQGRTQLLFCGGWSVASYNPEDGARYWVVDGPSQEFCASPVFSERTGLVYISSSWPQRHLLAIKPDGTGNVTDMHIAWRTTDGAFYVPSPILVGDYLLTTTTAGEVYCFDAASGKVHWTQKLGKQYPSAVTANGLVYMPNDEGVITVIRPGPVYQQVAQNSIGQRMNASPAVSSGQIFLRTQKHLFCIGH